MEGLVSFPNGDLRLEEVPVPALGDNPYASHDVLLEVEYCGVCGSDIRRWHGKSGVRLPPRATVTGHEIVGVVRETNILVYSVNKAGPKKQEIWDPPLIEEAIDCSILNRLSFWDALVVVAVEKARCDRLVTEDLNHGQIIRGVRVENPFQQKADRINDVRKR